MDSVLLDGEMFGANLWRPLPSTAALNFEHTLTEVVGESRRLVTLHLDGTLEFADCLTLDEAKEAICLLMNVLPVKNV